MNKCLCSGFTERGIETVNPGCPLHGTLEAMGIPGAGASMTGDEVRRQVRGALNHYEVDPDVIEALAALDGCVLLTAEEAALVLTHFGDYDAPDEWCRALLTPEGSDDAEDDPYPENPGPFGTNPGEC